eukprot:450486_1
MSGSITYSRPQSAMGTRPQSAMGTRPQSAMGTRPQLAMGITRPESAMGVRPQSAMGVRPQSAMGTRPQSSMGMRPSRYVPAPPHGHPQSARPRSASRLKGHATGSSAHHYNPRPPPGARPRGPTRPAIRMRGHAARSPARKSRPQSARPRSQSAMGNGRAQAIKQTPRTKRSPIRPHSARRTSPARHSKSPTASPGRRTVSPRPPASSPTRRRPVSARTSPSRARPPQKAQKLRRMQTSPQKLGQRGQRPSETNWEELVEKARRSKVDVLMNERIRNEIELNILEHSNKEISRKLQRINESSLKDRSVGSQRSPRWFPMLKRASLQTSAAGVLSSNADALSDRVEELRRILDKFKHSVNRKEDHLKKLSRTSQSLKPRPRRASSQSDCNKSVIVRRLRARHAAVVLDRKSLFEDNETLRLAGITEREEQISFDGKIQHIRETKQVHTDEFMHLVTLFHEASYAQESSSHELSYVRFLLKQYSKDLRRKISKRRRRCKKRDLNHESIPSYFHKEIKSRSLIDSEPEIVKYSLVSDSRTSIHSSDTAMTTQEPSESVLTTQGPSDTVMTTQEPSGVSRSNNGESDVVTREASGDSDLTTGGPIGDVSTEPTEPSHLDTTTKEPIDNAVSLSVFELMRLIICHVLHETCYADILPRLVGSLDNSNTSENSENVSPVQSSDSESCEGSRSPEISECLTETPNEGEVDHNIT